MIVVVLLLSLIYLKDNVMISESDRDVLVNINDRDIRIDSSKLEGKDGYDYFNTIFFERHKSLLYRSCKNMTVVLVLIYLLLSYLLFS